MSLIADALRKTNTPLSSPPLSSPTPAPRKRGLIYWGIGAFALLLVLGTRAALHPAPSLKKPSPALPTGSGSPAPVGFNLLRSAEGQWRLNGIVQGGPGKPLALINGQVVEEGDSISGAQVTRVASDQVDLATENGQTQTLTLR